MSYMVNPACVEEGIGIDVVSQVARRACAEGSE